MAGQCWAITSLQVLLSLACSHKLSVLWKSSSPFGIPDLKQGQLVVAGCSTWTTGSQTHRHHHENTFNIRDRERFVSVCVHVSVCA